MKISDSKWRPGSLSLWSPARRRLFVVGLALAAAGDVVLAAGVAGGKHDFSARGWGSSQVCVFCHAPHNAAASKPLWNHQTSTVTYTLYSSPTLKQSPQQPRGPSKLCLSCHDGSVALDSFGGKTGSQFISGGGKIGDDLSNDHPISVYWGHQTNTAGICSNCHNLRGGKVEYSLPFFEHYLECPTCHDPHGVGPEPKMLRKGLSGSALCLHCHGK